MFTHVTTFSYHSHYSSNPNKFEVHNIIVPRKVSKLVVSFCIEMFGIKQEILFLFLQPKKARESWQWKTVKQFCINIKFVNIANVCLKKKRFESAIGRQFMLKCLKIKNYKKETIYFVSRSGEGGRVNLDLKAKQFIFLFFYFTFLGTIRSIFSN